jgi:hypothetical protein
LVELMPDMNLKFLERGDLVLMEIPLEKYNRLQKQGELLSSEQLQNVDYATKEGYHPSMPRSTSVNGYKSSTNFQPI